MNPQSKSSTSSTTFAWSPCNHMLRRSEKNREVLWKLEPAIYLTHPRDGGPIPKVKVSIDTEKALEHTSDMEWSWHKSWNIPIITVRLEVKDPNTGEELLCPRNLYAELIACKIVMDDGKTPILHDVGLRGETKQEIQNGYVYFSGIKFASTSYNNEGMKFHLVITVYIEESERDEAPRSMVSYISPAIFVDSRKTSKAMPTEVENKTYNYFEPFSPEKIENRFIKKENKKRIGSEIEINGDVDGLLNYLTAPNIRNKIRHPIFLVLKFSQAVSIYYNIEKYNLSNYELLLEQLQRTISQETARTDRSIQNQAFLIQLKVGENEPMKMKRILECLEPLRTRNVPLLTVNDEIPDNFVELNNLEELKKAYAKSHKKLCIITPERPNKNEAQSSDEDDVEEKPRKRVKLDEESSESSLRVPERPANRQPTVESNGTRTAEPLPFQMPENPLFNQSMISQGQNTFARLLMSAHSQTSMQTNQQTPVKPAPLPQPTARPSTSLGEVADLLAQINTKLTQSNPIFNPGSSISNLLLENALQNSLMSRTNNMNMLRLLLAGGISNRPGANLAGAMQMNQQPPQPVPTPTPAPAQQPAPDVNLLSSLLVNALLTSSSTPLANPLALAGTLGNLAGNQNPVENLLFSMLRQGGPNPNQNPQQPNPNANRQNNPKESDNFPNIKFEEK